MNYEITNLLTKATQTALDAKKAEFLTMSKEEVYDKAHDIYLFEKIRDVLNSIGAENGPEVIYDESYLPDRKNKTISILRNYLTTKENEKNVGEKILGIWEDCYSEFYQKESNSVNSDIEELVIDCLVLGDVFCEICDNILEKSTLI